MHHDLNQQKGTKAPPSIIATLHLHPSNPAPFGERVSVWRKVAYGAGGRGAARIFIRTGLPGRTSG
jgi:hypothetical protein